MPKNRAPNAVPAIEIAGASAYSEYDATTPLPLIHSRPYSEQRRVEFGVSHKLDGDTAAQGWTLTQPKDSAKNNKLIRYTSLCMVSLLEILQPSNRKSTRVSMNRALTSFVYSSIINGCAAQ